MKQNSKMFIINFIIINIPIILTGAASGDDDEIPMSREIRQVYQQNPQEELEKILADPVFLDLQKMHAEFKKAKEELGRRKDTQEINDLEFSKQFENLRNSFNKKQQDFKARHNNKKSYSLRDSLKLIDQLRDLQKQEEFKLKQQYLYGTKETYNRPLFEKERLKIERLHEAVRTFIKLFTEEAKTKVEQEVMLELQKAQQEFKDAYYNLKEFYIPKGRETFNGEQELKEAEVLLAEEFNMKIKAIRTRLQQEMDSLLRANELAAAAQANAEEFAESLKNSTTAAKAVSHREETHSAAKLAKLHLLPEGKLRSHL